MNDHGKSAGGNPEALISESACRWVNWASAFFLLLIVVLPLLALVVAPWSNERLVSSGTPQASSFDARALTLLGRTLLLALSTAVIGTLLGLVAGHAISLQRQSVQRILLLLMTLPLLVPPFVHALSWIMIGARWFGGFHGFIPSLLVLALSLWPVAGWVCWSGFIHADGSLIDAARLGTGRRLGLWRIRLGLLRPHLMTGLIFLALFALSDYAVPSLFRINTYPVFVFSQFAARYDLDSGLKMAWPYILFPLIALAVWRRWIPATIFQSLGRHFKPALQGSTKAERRVWGGLFLLLLIISALVPLLALAGGLKGWDSIARAWKTAAPQVWTSLAVSATAATLLAGIGLISALALRSEQGWKRGSQDFLSLLPLALPGTLFGMGLIFLWNRPAFRWMDVAPMLVVLLYLARFIPFAVRTALAGMGSVEQGVWDAARLAPASPFRWLKDLFLPLMAPWLVVAWALVFVFSLHELAGTLLVIPPGFETLGVRIYSLYHYGASDLVAALSLLIITLSLSILGAGLAVYRWLTASWR